jgi:hypothetical protein
MMHTYPSDERRISDVELGRSCEAIIPLPHGGSLLPGDTVLFALSVSRPGQPPCYVHGGDSIKVSLTAVTDLGVTDSVTGQGLIRIAWVPLGQFAPPVIEPGRGGKSRRSRRMTPPVMSSVPDREALHPGHPLTKSAESFESPMPRAHSGTLIEDTPDVTLPARRPR